MNSWIDKFRKVLAQFLELCPQLCQWILIDIELEISTVVTESVWSIASGKVDDV